jgi:hypothetical protein
MTRARRAAWGLAILLGLSGAARAQGRPSDDAIFGGGATAGGPDGGAPAEPDGGAPADAAAPTPPPAEVPGTAPAAAATPEGRDQALLGAPSTTGEIQHLSDYQAPENPLQIGGQIYLRTQSTARQGDSPGSWSLSAPSLLDVYFDARPNPRVRGFILGRMSYDATVPPDATTGMAAASSQGAFTGSSVTGFTTFNPSRGPNALLDQLWLRFDLGQRVFVTVGKQHVRWGTGRFWQPTDYLHQQKRNPLDVFDARGGTTMLKLHVPWEARAWNFYGFAVADEGGETGPATVGTASTVFGTGTTLRQVAGGARAEIVILGAELGLDVLAKRDRKPRFGIDLSTGIGDFDVYADVGIRHGEDFNKVVPATGTNGMDCVLSDGTPVTTDVVSQKYAVTQQSGIKTQTVVGLNYARKYNDNDLWTIGAEYFYNQPGYADTSVYPGLLFNQSNQPQLNFFYTGRHYGALFLSLPAPYSWNRTNFTVSTLGNLSDLSFVTRLDVAHTLLTHLSVEAFVGVHYGSRSGEFRLGVDVDRQYALNPNGTSPDPSLPLCDAVPPFSSNPLLLDLGVALRIRI